MDRPAHRTMGTRPLQSISQAMGVIGCLPSQKQICVLMLIICYGHDTDGSPYMGHTLWTRELCSRHT